MKINFPIGVDDFRNLRQCDLTYIDKTHLAMEIIDHPGRTVMLIPRPRRFGKSLNLSMLRYYFERSEPPDKENRASLFQGLRIWEAGGPYRKHLGRYPVIALSFKGVKQDTAEGAIAALKEKVQRAYDYHHGYLLPGLQEHEKERYAAILKGTADDTQYATGLLHLCKYLQRQSGEQTLVLLDEYDEPLHSAYLYGYAARFLPFYRTLLSELLKDNPYLWKGVLSGILRVARESIFSDLNNLGVYTLLRPQFNTCYGFTEPEVVSLLARLGRPELLSPIRTWYNGYVFGGVTVYNPWSVMSFLDSAGEEPRGYWTRTSSNDLVKDQLRSRAVMLQPIFEDLLAGGSVEREVAEDTALSQLASDEGTLWSLLVFTGYLKAEKIGPPIEDGPTHYRLSIPNREIREIFVTTFKSWLDQMLQQGGGGVERLKLALFSGDDEGVQAQLQTFVTNVLSYHDVAQPPEQVYHAFLTGLLAALEPGYQVRSNREAGAGRPDVQIFPVRPGGPGVALELKVATPGKRTPQKALEQGLAQIRSKGYTAELLARGAQPIQCYAVAMRGKQVWVKRGGRAASGR
jgi:hypothetical protein